MKQETSGSNGDPSGGEKKKQSVSEYWFFATVASIVLFIITMSLFFYSFSLSSEIKKRQNKIEQQKTQIVELKNEIQRSREYLAILESREVKIVILNGLEVNPKGYGKLIWDTVQRRALLQVANLPPVSRGKTYQLWFICKNRPVSAGLFKIKDPRKDTFFIMEESDISINTAAVTIAVTLEPEEGSAQPVGQMYLLGKSKQ